MHITDLISTDDLIAELAAGTIKCSVSPDGLLHIYNYAPQAAYAGLWTPAQRVCRGLITETDGTIIARAFDKFFNLGEQPETRLDALPAGPMLAMDKIDGSLGVIFWHAGQPHVATRGSFTSPQAQWATAWLRANVDQDELRRWTLGYSTLLVEIIIPVSRIVVDYGAGNDGLVLLAERDTRTGDYTAPGALRNLGDILGLRVAEARMIDRLDDLLDDAATRVGIEGWVVAYPNGLRVKIKTDEYRTLHRLMMSCTVPYVRRLLEEYGEAILSDYLPKLPALLRGDVLRVANTLMLRYYKVKASAEAAFIALSKLEDRGTFARAVTATGRKDSAVLFHLWDMEH
ncbi:MAG: RNA ligase, partial [Chloroflexales bacterium]